MGNKVLLFAQKNYGNCFANSKKQFFGHFLLNSTVFFAGLLISMTCIPMSFAQTSADLANADDWLTAAPPKSYTIQLATVYGLDQCKSVANDYQVDSVHCFESSTVPDRWFAVTGVFSDQQSAKQASIEIGANDAWINYIPRILETRCEMPDLDANLKQQCQSPDSDTQTVVTQTNTSPQVVTSNDAQNQSTQDNPTTEPFESEEISNLKNETGSSVARITQGLLERVSLDIDRFQILGDNPLNGQDSKAVLEPYVGENKGIDDIESAADALEKALIAKGFSFYRVSLPPQELTDNIVDILVKRYQIGKILVEGNNYYSDDNIISSLPSLRPGESPSTVEIARSLRFANQNPAKRVRVTLAPGQSIDEIDAQVVVLDTNPLVANVWLNNTGTDASGDYRVGASIAHNNLLDRDHSASLSFITSPEGLDDVQQFALSYGIPFYRLGGKLNFIAVESDIDTGTVADVFEVAGRGEVYGLSYLQSLATINNFNHQVSLQINDKLFDNDVQFEGLQLLEDVRSRPLSLAYQANWSDQNGLVLNGSIATSSNLSGGSFNSERSYLASRVGSSNDWSKVDLSFSLQYSLKGWLYSAGAKTSTSSDRLITGEQFAIGGSNSIRGMEERELRGDEGYQINLQASAPMIAKNLQPSLFIDAGRVENNAPSNGEFDSETVMSAGVSLNWNPNNNISASASYGYLVDGIEETESISNASQDGDSKLHFNLSYRF